MTTPTEIIARSMQQVLGGEIFRYYDHAEHVLATLSEAGFVVEERASGLPTYTSLQLQMIGCQNQLIAANAEIFNLRHRAMIEAATDKTGD